MTAAASNNLRHVVFAMWTWYTLCSVILVQSAAAVQCGTDLGVLTAAQIRAAGKQLMEQFIPDDPELLDRAVSIIFLPADGDVSVRALCASCQDLDLLYAETQREFPVYHPTYCDSNSTGYATALSFLVLEPRGTSQALPDKAKLRPFITFPPTSDTAASQQFVQAFFTSSETESGTNTTEDVSDLLAFYLPSLVATSAGAIGLIPDYPGFGVNTEQPTVFQQKFYEQALAVPLLYLKHTISEQTELCTLIDTAATVYGVGDGAQAAVHATLLLQRFGFSPLQTFLSAGPLDLNLWLTDISANYTMLSLNSASVNMLDTWLQLTASTYGTSASAEVVAANGGSPLVLDPKNPTYTPCPFINATEAITTVTDEGSPTPSLCNALTTLGSAWRAFDGSLDRQWSTPLSACFSNTDELVSPEHYTWAEEALAIVASEQSVATESSYRRYTGPTAFTTLAIDETTNANHVAAVKLCSVAPMLFFTLGGFIPEDEVNQGNYQKPLNNNGMILCTRTISSPSTPSSPVSEPAMAPTEGSPSTEGDTDDSPSTESDGGDNASAPSPTLNFETPSDGSMPSNAGGMNAAPAPVNQSGSTSSALSTRTVVSRVSVRAMTVLVVVSTATFALI